MIRAACTWMLIVLAASPFTAPFSTCDVSALIADHTSTVMVSAVAACTDVRECSSAGDAGTISPLVVRVELSREAVLVHRDWIRPTSDTPAITHPIQSHRALEDSPHQSTVLRL